MSMVNKTGTRIVFIIDEWDAVIRESGRDDEAKERYPEFKDVIDAKNVDYNSQNKGSLIYRIGNNGTPNLDIKDLSLELLKKQYGQLISTQKREQYYNFKTTAIEGLFKLLNIKKMNKTYILCVFRSADEYKEKHLQSFQLPKTKENLKEAAKRRWENKESREQMEKWWEAQRLAWDRHPEITEQKAEIAKSYTGLAKILDKKRKKIPLTKGEKIYLKKYYKECIVYKNHFTQPGDYYSYHNNSYVFQDRNI